MCLVGDEHVAVVPQHGDRARPHRPRRRAAVLRQPRAEQLEAAAEAPDPSGAQPEQVGSAAVGDEDVARRCDEDVERLAQARRLQACLDAAVVRLEHYDAASRPVGDVEQAAPVERQPARLPHDAGLAWQRRARAVAVLDM
jgi:hypothetical protein